jgi:hypothetical protein
MTLDELLSDLKALRAALADHYLVRPVHRMIGRLETEGLDDLAAARSTAEGLVVARDQAWRIAGDRRDTIAAMDRVNRDLRAELRRHGHGVSPAHADHGTVG